MKIAIVCDSQLLQKSLEMFLDEHIVNVKNCDIIVSDKKLENSNKDILYIDSSDNADLKKPFSKSQLLLAIDKLLKKQRDRGTINEISASIVQNTKEEITAPQKKDFSILERRIEQITHDYKTDIVRAIKAFYEE